MRDAIGKFKFAIACKTIQDQGKILIAFHVAGTFEELVQYCTYNDAG